MNSTIVVSDVHGATIWKEIAACRNPGDSVVFLGDYFDQRGDGPFAMSQTANFLEICAYARANPHTYLLVGNHDIQYLYPVYETSSSDGRIAENYSRAIKANMDILHMAHVDYSVTPPLLYSHGGLTRTFCRNNGIDVSRPEELNELWRRDPQAFCFILTDPVSGKYSRMDGDSPWQSPTWVRTWSMEKDAIPDFDQVTGHTPVRTIAVYRLWWGGWCALTCTWTEEYLRVVRDNHKANLLVENCASKMRPQKPYELTELP